MKLINKSKKIENGKPSVFSCLECLVNLYEQAME